MDYPYRMLKSVLGHGYTQNAFSCLLLTILKEYDHIQCLFTYENRILAVKTDFDNGIEVNFVNKDKLGEMCDVKSL